MIDTNLNELYCYSLNCLCIFNYGGSLVEPNSFLQNIDFKSMECMIRVCIYKCIGLYIYILYRYGIYIYICIFLNRSPLSPFSC